MKPEDRKMSSGILTFDLGHPLALFTIGEERKVQNSFYQTFELPRSSS